MDEFIEARVKVNNGIFTVIGNKLLLLPVKQDEKYGDSDIVIPERYRRWVKFGVIVGIGEEVERSQYFMFKIGVKAFYSSGFIGVDITINDIVYKIINPDDVECVEEG